MPLQTGYPLGQYSERIPKWLPSISQPPNFIVRYNGVLFQSREVINPDLPLVNLNQSPSNKDFWFPVTKWDPTAIQIPGQCVTFKNILFRAKMDLNPSLCSACPQPQPTLCTSKWEPYLLEPALTTFGNPALKLNSQQENPLDTLLQGQRGLLIAHGVGSGKTLTGLSIAINLLYFGHITEARIVVPVKLASQWEANIQRFVPREQISKIKLATQEQMLLLLNQTSTSLSGGDDLIPENGLGGLDSGGLAGGTSFVLNEEIIDDTEIVELSNTVLREEFLNSVDFLHCLQPGEDDTYDLSGGQNPEVCPIQSSLIIFDEAHELRDQNTQLQFLARRLADQCLQVVTMTATPIVNKPADLSIHFQLFTKQQPTKNAKFLQDPSHNQTLTGQLPFDDDAIFNVYTIDKENYILDPKVLDDCHSQADSSLEDESMIDLTETEYFLDLNSIPHQASKIANQVSTYNIENKPGAEYPERRDIDPELTTVFMTDEQQTVQSQIKEEKTDESKQNDAFLVKTRQACNTVQDQVLGNPSVSEPKIQAIVSVIQRSLDAADALKRGVPVDTASCENRLPIIVQSEFRDKGVDRMKSVLTNLQQSTGRSTSRILYLTGSTKKEEVDRIRQKLLDPTSQDVFLISKAGSVGINTKGVRQIHVMEPPWNQTALDQTIGRAIRFQSHKDLPMQDRNVCVFQWSLKKTPAQQAQDLARGRDPRTADEQVVAEVLGPKVKVNRLFIDLLVCNSIESLIHNERDICNSQVLTLLDQLKQNLPKITEECRLEQDQQPLRFQINSQYSDFAKSGNLFKTLDIILDCSGKKMHQEEDQSKNIHRVLNKISAIQDTIQMKLTNLQPGAVDFKVKRAESSLAQIVPAPVQAVAATVETVVQAVQAAAVPVVQAVQAAAVPVVQAVVPLAQAVQAAAGPVVQAVLPVDAFKVPSRLLPYFEPQTGLKCLRHALNMAVGQPQFVIRDDSVIESGDTINLEALCRETNKLYELQLNRKENPLFFLQCGCDNYDRDMVSLALAYSRREYSEVNLQQKSQRAELLDAFRLRLPEQRTKQYSMIFQDVERSHQQALRQFDKVWWNLDSLNPGPIEVDYAAFVENTLNNESILGLFVIFRSIEENLQNQEVAARIRAYQNIIQEGLELKAAAEATVLPTQTAVPQPTETVVMKKPRVKKPKRVDEDIDPRERLKALMARYEGPEPASADLEKVLAQKRAELEERRREQVRFEQDVIRAQTETEVAAIQERRQKVEDERYQEAREALAQQRQRERRLFEAEETSQGLPPAAPAITFQNSALDALRKNLGL